GRFETVPMRFDRVEDAVASGEVDCGVLIHEGRFTYARRGLVLLRDLGEVWEEGTGLPVPLGAIAVRRDLGVETARRAEEAIRASVRYARRRPDASADYVRGHAREMDPEVCRRHIALYVNEYTLDLDPAAVERLLALGVETGAFPPAADPIFLT
ncbi:MAG: MqnA/MqnD/SBP family protein, partial [Planctomycetota bacterium]